MPTWGWIVIAIAAVVVLAAIAWSAYSGRRRKGLQERFGSEYDRTVADAPSRREAESELSEREKRRQELDIRPLEQSARDRYASEWQNTQAKFVDDPEAAVGDADRLIQQVMRDRGHDDRGGDRDHDPYPRRHLLLLSLLTLSLPGCGDGKRDVGSRTWRFQSFCGNC